ncbi:MAG: hypothetical protein ACLUFP_10130 [Streptococcus salivarius]
MSWGLYDGTTKIDDINTDTVGYKDYTLKQFPRVGMVKRNLAVTDGFIYFPTHCL